MPSLGFHLQVAQEVFGLSRVVRTFGTEEREVDRYKRWLQSLRDINVRQACAYLIYLISASSLFNLTKVCVEAISVCRNPAHPKFPPELQ